MYNVKLILVGVAAFLCGILFVASCGGGSNGNGLYRLADDIGQVVNDVVGEVSEVHVADATAAPAAGTPCKQWIVAIVVTPDVSPNWTCSIDPAGKVIGGGDKGAPCDGLPVGDGWEPFAPTGNGNMWIRKCIL